MLYPARFDCGLMVGTAIHCPNLRECTRIGRVRGPAIFNIQHLENGRTELGVAEMEPLLQTSQLQDEALVAQQQAGRFRIDTFWLEEINTLFEELCLGQERASISNLFEHLKYKACLYKRNDCPSYSTVRRVFHSIRTAYLQEIESRKLRPKNISSIHGRSIS